MHSGSHVQDAGAQVLMKTGLYGALAVWWFLAFRVWDFRAHRLDANRERGFRAKIVFAVPRVFWLGVLLSCFRLYRSG